MIKKDKNKSRLKARSKILVLGLILIILVGLFGPMANVQAQSWSGTLTNGDPGTAGTCIVNNHDATTNSIPFTREQCQSYCTSKTAIDSCDFKVATAENPAPTEPTAREPCVVNPDGSTNTNLSKPNCTTEAERNPPPAAKKGFQLPDCTPSSWTVAGCFINITYFLVWFLPSIILWLAAYLFNTMVALTLSTLLYSGGFIAEAWRIVRDFSNIFFILILLYIAIKMILGIGGAEIKKMIVQVIIAALLINFSMFFTQVVIDSSNILALIFYNKITINIVKDVNGVPKEIPYGKVVDADIGVEQKDVAGGIVNSFDPSTKLSAKMFDAKVREVDAQNTAATVSTAGILGRIGVGVAVPVIGAAQLAVYLFGGQTFDSSLYLVVIFVGGAIFLFAAYAFFIAALAFIGRLIELWLLIIFSPFAFMSLTIPELKGVDWLGWTAWSKRLISIAFMAPIFMFMMLILSKIIQAGIIESLADTKKGSAQTAVLIIITALINLTLLLKAVHYAKKGGGQFGEMAVKYGGMVAGLAGGLALTAASGGATTLIAGAGGAALNKTAKYAESKGYTGAASRLRNASGFLRDVKFDPRGLKVGGKSLGSMTGTGEAKGLSFNEKQKKTEEKRLKRAEQLEKRGTGKEKKDVDIAEIKLKEAVLQNITAEDADGNPVELPVKLHLQNVDKEIDKARIKLNDVKGTGNVVATNDALADLRAKQAKKDIIRDTRMEIDGEMISIKELEKVRDKAKVDLDVKSDVITTAYAKKISGKWSKGINLVARRGFYSTAGADETARKIRTGTKLDSGEKPK